MKKEKQIFWRRSPYTLNTLFLIKLPYMVRVKHYKDPYLYSISIDGYQKRKVFVTVFYNHQWLNEVFLLSNTKKSIDPFDPFLNHIYVASLPCCFTQLSMISWKIPSLKIMISLELRHCFPKSCEKWSKSLDPFGERQKCGETWVMFYKLLDWLLNLNSPFCQHAHSLNEG